MVHHDAVAVIPSGKARKTTRPSLEGLNAYMLCVTADVAQVNLLIDLSP